MSMDWSWLCGTRSLVVWANDDFGQCFRTLSLECPAYVVLAVMSAYCLGNRVLYLQRTPAHLYLLTARKLIVLGLFLCTVVTLGMKQLRTPAAPLLIYEYVGAGVQCLAWILHVAFLYCLRTRMTTHSRGPCAVVFSWLLTVVVTCLDVRTIIIEQHRVPSMDDVDLYSVYVRCALHLLYFCSLVPKGSARETFPRRLASFVGSSRQPLVADSYSESYGAISGRSGSPVPLGIAERRTNFLSRLTLYWVNPLLQKGCAKRLNSPEDLFELPSKLRTTYVDTKFWIVFRDLQLRRSLVVEQRERMLDASAPSSSADFSQSVRPSSILLALLRSFGFEYFLLGGLKLMSDGSAFLGPLLLNMIVNYIEQDDDATAGSMGYYYVLGLFGTTFFSSFCNSQFTYLLNNLKLQVRASLISMVYRKTLHVRSSTMASFNIGEIVNFMSTDADRIVNMCDSFHAFWIQPIQIAACLFLLHLQVGPAYIAGVAFAVMLIPLNHWIANRIGKLSSFLMEKKDRRVKVMTELLYGIKVIKYYSWEGHLWDRISALREAEVKSLRGRKYLDAFCVFFWAITPVAIAVLTFSTYVLFGNQLTVAKVFTCLALFNMLIVPLNAFPWVIGGVVEGCISVKRVQKLVQVKESNLTKCYVAIDESSNCAIYIRNGQFVWDRGAFTTGSYKESQTSIEVTDNKFYLSDINFEIFKGQMVGVCGPVGCGKSSLLLAMLSEMDRMGGEMGSSFVADGFAYVAQDPWIQNGTVKQNILFGRPMQLARYYDAINACALEEDLKAFPAGDNTLIGERGINLSGGQKTRIALARAIYQDKELYLMDDVMSTVDVHVAQHIMQHCMFGMLRQKTRVLCTHHWNYLKKADHILLMREGRIVKQGRPDVVFVGDDNVLEYKVETTIPDSGIEKRGDENPTHERTASGDSKHSSGNENPGFGEEEWERGTVKSKVYQAYALAIGSVMTPLIILSIVVMQALKNVSDWWLAHWMSETSPTSPNRTLLLPADCELERCSSVGAKSSTGHDFAFYLIVYCVLVGSNALVSLVRAFSFAYGGVSAAVKLHNDLLQMILRASSRFFEVTPVGRIVNRFSTDTYVIDDDLPFVLNILLAQTAGLAGTLVIICYSLPWLLLLLVPLTVVYCNVQHFYRHTSRALRRLEAVTLSPIYAHFSESVLGLTTIRAFRSEARFKRENEERLERNQRTMFSLGATGSWLSLRLQLIGVVVVTGIGFLAILEHNFQGINPGLVGLALSYGLSITAVLSAVVQQCTETEKQVVSVERTLQYIEGIEPERWEGFTKPPAGWPGQGVVAFHNVYLRYRDHLPFALDEVSFRSCPAEKLGIVGRTGSGKSSLFAALFRLVEVEKGGITIDGQVLAYLDLVDLRSQVTIIPQDPFIFSGTVRDNLDPPHSYSDDELWEAMHQCHISDVVRRLGGLDVELAEGGGDFSMGQRQLLCLVRAVLAKTKVLCIDEATANVDRDTDRLVQKTIRTAFKESTVLTIAHRLETVLDSDRILLMSHGKVVELDTPQALLSNPESRFYQLVHKREWSLS